MSRRNGRINKMETVSDLALEKAVLLGATKPVRIKVNYQCTECHVTLKSSHVIPENKAPEGLTGLLVPCICAKCLEKKVGESTCEA